MKISKETVVSFHYRLKKSSGEIFESSFDTEPVAYLHGVGNIIPGLESAMEGKSAGENFEVKVVAAQAYGARNQNAEQRVPIKHLQGAKKWRVGMPAQVQTEQGVQQVTILKLGKFMATVDTNHPLAGEDLEFEIQITDVRAASSEEIAHGHVHGPGGHEH